MAFVDLNKIDIQTLTSSKAQEEFYDSSFPGPGSFGIRINSRSKKVFFFIYSLNRKRKRMTLGTYPSINLAQARTQALNLLSRVAAGQDPAAEDRHYKNAETFGQAAELFLERHVKQNCKASTAREYRRILEVELLPCWKDRKLLNIQQKDILSLLEQISIERNSPVMANRIRSLISRIFSFAVSRKLIEKNPIKNISPAPAQISEERILNLDELTQLWLALDREDPLISGVFKLLILTGQRPAEVMSMRWDDIVLDTWSMRSTRASSDRRHQVHLSQQSLQVLRNIRADTERSEYVFPSRQGKPIVYIRKAARRINESMKGALPWSPMDLRKSVQFHLRSLGIRPEVIERIQNRSTLSSPLKKYFETYDYTADIKKALTLWGRKIAQLSGKPSPPDSDAKVISLFQ